MLSNYCRHLERFQSCYDSRPEDRNISSQPIVATKTWLRDKRFKRKLSQCIASNSWKFKAFLFAKTHNLLSQMSQYLFCVFCALVVLGDPKSDDLFCPRL